MIPSHLILPKTQIRKEKMPEKRQNLFFSILFFALQWDIKQFKQKSV